MTLAQRIGSAYLIYLSFMPAVGTVALIGLLGIYINPLIFLVVGTAGIGIYLAMMASYTRLSASAVKNALIFIDGPLWAALGVLMGGSLATFLVDEVLIEASSALFGLFALVLTSNKPTRGQRIASLFAVGIPLLGAAWVFWRYAEEYVLPIEHRIWFLLAAIVQGAITNYRLSNDDTLYRPADGYIVIGITAWVASLFIGYGLANYLHG